MSGGYVNPACGACLLPTARMRRTPSHHPPLQSQTRQREEAKKLKETVKAESRASVWAERASLHTANQGILQGTIEKEKRLSVQVSHAWAKWITRGEKQGPSFVPPFGGALTKLVPFPLDRLNQGEHGCELRAAGRGEEPCECYELGVQHRRCGQEERNVEGAGRGASKEAGGAFDMPRPRSSVP